MSGTFSLFSAAAIAVSAFAASAAERDSTMEIQSALDKGGKVVIKREGSPWCVRPLRVSSNTDIFFEDGAVLRALTNAYFKHDASVLNLVNVSNVTIRGRGTVQMNKYEYVQRDKGYEVGDARHCIAMRGVRGVLVEDMTMLNAGADGVYVTGWRSHVRASENVTLRRVTCDGGHRQGVSVISVVGFLAEDCNFINTKGTSPQAGLDFEPNYVWEKLVDCKVLRCTFKNNAGTGLHISPHWLTDASEPVSITVSGCKILDSGFCGLEFMRNGKGRPPKGKCVVTDTLISGTSNHGIVFTRKFSDMFSVTLRNVTIENSGRKNPQGADVHSSSRFWEDDPPGNIEMDNVVIRQPSERPWFAFTQRGLGMKHASGWKGAVRVVSPSGEKKIDLDDNWVKSTFDPPGVSKMPFRVAPDFENAKVVDLHPGEMRDLQPLHSVTPDWVFYVDRPKTCSFRMRQVAWVTKTCRVSLQKVIIEGLSANTRGEWRLPQPGAESGIIEFYAKEPGFYRLHVSTGSSKKYLEAANVPVACNLTATGGKARGMVRMFCAAEKSSLRFAPQQGEDFSIVAGGKDAGVRMTLSDPSGKKVWEDPKVVKWNSFTACPASSGLWTLDLFAPEVKKAPQSYSFTLDLLGTPGCLFLDPDRYWTFPKPPKPLKVLMIGNSFSICVLREMPEICADMKLPLDLCSLYIGGCPLWKHVENLSSNAHPYLVTWNYRGRKDRQAVPFLKIADNSRNKAAGSILRQMIAADDWDYVTIQQASHESWDFANYEPHGTKLIEAIREHAPRAKIIVQQTWSYNPLSPRLTKWKLDIDSMFDRVEAAYGQFAKGHALDLIRMGEAVSRFRKQYPVEVIPRVFNPDDVVGKNLTCRKNAAGEWQVSGDTIHLNDRGEFLQGLVWTAKLFDVDVTKSKYLSPCMITDKKGAALMRRIASDLR